MRQPFSAVENPEFQEMLLAGAMYDDFLLRRDNLFRELEINYVSISFTLDM
jgi:hypothetical protein